MPVTAGGSASEVAAGVAIRHRNQRVLLKWHKLRRAAGAPPFDPENIRAGLALGASVEIDVRRLADGAWVCLHDAVLDEETDGRGPVAALDSAAARRLRIAGAAYAPPLLADVAAVAAEALAARGAADAALVQLDIKEPAERMDADAVASLAEALGPIASICIVSGYDWAPQARLRDAIRGLRAGFDPFERARTATLATGADFERFLREVLDDAPDADAFYLHHRFVSASLETGVNPVALLRGNGAFVDVWTLDPTTPDIVRILPQVVVAGADQITTNAPLAMEALWQRLAG